MAQLVFRCFQYAVMRGGKIFTRAIDIEIQHRHRRAKGGALRRSLRCAERFKDAAIRFGLSDLKASFSTSIASQVAATFADHLVRRFCGAFLGADLRWVTDILFLHCC
jgi:hypothetical protein